MTELSIIDDILVREKIADAPTLARARKVQQRDGGSFGRVLARLGVADEDVIARSIARGMNLPHIDPNTVEVDSTVAALLPPEFCRQRLVLPIRTEGRSMRLAMADPLDLSTIQDVEFRIGMPVSEAVISESHLSALLDQFDTSVDDEKRAYDLLASASPAGEFEAAETDLETIDVSGLEKNTGLPPIVRLVNLVLSDAAKLRASDIHIEPQEQQVQVRYRVDGLLQDALKIPKKLQDSTISRLKILSRMDIAERRRPQDGRSRLRFEGKRIDLRVSTLPTQFGEKVVIRLLDPETVRMGMERIGFSPETLERLQTMLTRPQGVILVTGPTGSGKTTTLYSCLGWLKSATKNIITVEDPIEFQIPGINQVQINKKAGVTFASGLRSILRQDPNIVLVGEIRDQETADIALEAAQTGHLLLSTLHTNDAASTITRLLDLELEPFLVASSITGVLAQRLLRQVCAECAVERPPSEEVVHKVGGDSRLPANTNWMAGPGCARCGQTGYKGRLGIHELLEVTDEIREMIGRRAADHLIRDAARRNGMRTLMEDGIAKAALGQTTLDEVLRVAPPDEARAAPAAPVTARASAAPGGAQAVQRVLVVEDSPTEISVVRYFLEIEGYEVLVAENGRDGLAMARAQRPDVVITDLNMPQMDGLALVKALRADPEARGVKIVILTSDTDVEKEEQGLALGADDFIPKPVEPRRLIARVRSLLSRSQAIPAAGA